MHEIESRRVIPIRNSGIGRNSQEFRAIPCRYDFRNSIPELDASACSGVTESSDDYAIPESDGILAVDATGQRHYVRGVPDTR